MLPCPVPRAFTQDTLPPRPRSALGLTLPLPQTLGKQHQTLFGASGALSPGGEGRGKARERAIQGWARFWLRCFQAGHPAFPSYEVVTHKLVFLTWT